MKVDVKYSKLINGQVTEELQIQINESDEMITARTLIKFIQLVKNNSSHEHSFTQSPAAEIRQYSDIKLTFEEGGEVDVYPDQKITSEEVIAKDIQISLQESLEKDKEPQFKCTCKLPGLTERQIDLTPVHGLRGIIARLHWMNIPNYSKMHVKELRIKMKEQLEEFIQTSALTR